MRRFIVIIAVWLVALSCDESAEVTDVAGTVTFQSTNSPFSEGRLYVTGYSSRVCVTSGCDDKVLEFEVVTDNQGNYSFVRETEDVDYFEVSPDVVDYFGSNQSLECVSATNRITAGSDSKNFDIVIDCEVN